MWSSSSNYRICKGGNGYCAALSGLPRGKAGRIGCPDPQDLFCPPRGVCPQGHAWESMPWPGKGWVSEPQEVQHVGQGTSCCAVQCLWVAADFQPSQYLQGYFSSRAANPMCHPFKGMLFLPVQSASGVKQGAAKQVSKETPECLLGSKGILGWRAQLSSFAWPLTLRPFLCSLLVFGILPSECDSESSPGNVFKGAAKMPKEKAKWQEKTQGGEENT